MAVVELAKVPLGVNESVNVCVYSIEPYDLALHPIPGSIPTLHPVFP